MVGDYFSRMATAQNMPPQALNKSVQDGVLTPNMASDAMQSQARSASSQGIQSLQSPPIAQQVMQEADQLTAPEKLAREIEHVRGNIQRVQDGVQTGAIEAYKGIPFLKEQIDTLRGLEQQLQILTNPQQAMPQMAQQMPPQQMAQAPQGIDAAQSNLPAEGYAGGGIVAFADNQNQPVSSDMPATDVMGNVSYGDSVGSNDDRSIMERLGIFNPANRRVLEAGEKARAAKVAPTAPPTAEPAKNTGIVIHDTKPAKTAGPAAAPVPRTDLGIPLVYGPPEEDTVATTKRESSASNEELKKLILGDPEARDKQFTIQTLLKIMQGGLKAAGGTSPYAMANIGPAAAETAGGIGELYAQQEAAKEKRVGQLVALGLKGQELNAELAKMGITKKYYDMHAPLLAAQAAEAGAKIPLYGAQAKWWAGRPYTTPGATAGMPKGIPFESMRKVEAEFKGYTANPKTIMASPLEPLIPPKTDPKNGWIRQGLETSPGTPSYNNAMNAVREIAEIEKNKIYQKGYLLGGRTTAPGVFTGEEE
jgi:hypothetical protein